MWTRGYRADSRQDSGIRLSEGIRFAVVERDSELTGNDNGRCSSASLTRPFRNAPNRCPTQCSSQKERPALKFYPESADRRLVSTDQLRLPSPTNKAFTPSVVHLPVFKVT